MAKEAGDLHFFCYVDYQRLFIMKTYLSHFPSEIQATSICVISILCYATRKMYEKIFLYILSYSDSWK